VTIADTTPNGRLEPVARRSFCHPATGQVAVLAVEHGDVSGGPRLLAWRVSLEEATGSPPAVAKLPFMPVHDTRDAARRAFAERQRALRAAGCEGVE
jgi:hypothetical protein